MKHKKKAKKSAKKADTLTYFLDHPDIKREECIGNGSSPGPSAPSLPSANVSPSEVRGGSMAGTVANTGRPSIASQINFGGKK